MVQNSKFKIQNYICKTPEETFEFGEKIGESLAGGEMILLKGTLGVGKTLLTKGIVNSLGFDFDEVTSPSFTLVNLYKTDKFDVYHIDLWRIDEKSNAAFAVGLDEILENENTIVIIEWAERLKNFTFPAKTFSVKLEGDGDDPRKISVSEDL